VAAGLGVGYGNPGVNVLGQDDVMVGVVLVGLLVFVEVIWMPEGMILVEFLWGFLDIAMLAPLG
jgi:hypothetical protein